MAGILESLQNPLERVGALSSAGSFSQNIRVNPLTNNAVWTAGTQYFVGDCAIDPDDGLLYVWTGPVVVPPAVAPVSVRGGDSPAVSWGAAGGWQRAGGVYYDTLSPTTADGGAGVITVTGGVFNAPADTDWLVTLQGTHTPAAPPLVAADLTTYTLTGNGGGSAQSFTIVPAATANSQSWSQTALITVGAAGTSITLTGAYAGAFLPTGATLKATFVRLF